jgi:hypothetical protein
MWGNENCSSAYLKKTQNNFLSTSDLQYDSIVEMSNELGLYRICSTEY